MLVLLFAAAITIPQTGRVVLPAGTVEISSELKVTGHDLVIVGNPKGTTLQMTQGFTGRAAMVFEHAANVRLVGFAIDGRRALVKQTIGLPPSNVRFADFYKRNGILVDGVEGMSMDRLGFKNLWGFPILVSRSKRVKIERVGVNECGGKNGKGRNNTTGGILFEEGTTDFEVRQSVFDDVLGNGVWTHSNYGSPRNERGLITENIFHRIGRDAIQVGHATGVQVLNNVGDHIGYPFDAVDIESGATPVGIDTSGNVDHTVYTQNRFREVNGKCIDLDGFHDGEVTFNTCVNTGTAESYPHGHFGIVVNNYNPDMRSEHITIADNTIDGAKFGGVFLIGSNHTVVRNKLLNLNLAHCNESAAKIGCVAIQGEPDVLQAGIYLGRIAAEWAQKRADASHGHVIRDNVVTGFKMKARCVMAAPGVDLKASTVGGNDCRDVEGDAKQE